MQRELRILIAEDNKADVFLVRQALAQHRINADVTVHADGEAMVRTIERIEAGQMPCPDLVMLDLNLPKRSGDFVLARLRSSPQCAHVPVIIVTSSEAPLDRQTASRMGANVYFCKPSDYDQFMLLGGVVADLMALSKPVE